MSPPILTTAHFPHPPSQVLSYLHHTPNLLTLNHTLSAHELTSPTPPTYTLQLRIPVLFGLFTLPVTTSAVVENRDDGVYVTTKTGAVETSSRWTVVGDGSGGSEVVEEFMVLRCWWGVAWWVRWTARVEHAVLMEVLGERLGPLGE